mmetsp:Transcript_46605/g.117355  ORF Transcript_46605/g.117355 Transcript_46605/m.117355 type:complete len:817 (-) Transcript_46605:7-2457(-)
MGLPDTGQALQWNREIASILSLVKPQDDVAEFLTTNILVAETLAAFKENAQFATQAGALATFQGSEPDSAQSLAAVLQSVYTALKRFRDALHLLKSGGNLTRFLTSNRLRGRIEQLNIVLHTEAEALSKQLTSPDGAGGKQTNAGASGGAHGVSATQGDGCAGSRCRPNLERMKTGLTESISSAIQDEEALTFWKSTFGVENGMVPWGTFIKGLSALYRRDISFDDESLLQYILDNSLTGFVSPFRFGEILKGFGPLKGLLVNVRRILSETWFVGFLSSEEANKLLIGQPPGTFLVRFSKSKTGSFALALVYGSRIIHTLVHCNHQHHFRIEEAGKGVMSFKSLYNILDYYKTLLSAPYSSSLLKSSWFYGDITRAETEELLSDSQKVGTFLIRFSDQRAGELPGGYMCSYVSVNGVQHMEIPIKGSQLISNTKSVPSGTVSATIEGFVKSNRVFLKYNYDKEGVPRLKARPAVTDAASVQYTPDVYIAGPANAMDGSTARIGANVFGRSDSSYPTNPGGWKPICDRFSYLQLGTRALACITDGCNWGQRSLEASKVANDTFMRYMQSKMEFINDAKEAGHHLLRAFSVAHDKIVEGKDDIWMAGSTTILGGVLLQLDELMCNDTPTWCFVCASLGDCKAYQWHAGEQRMEDLTFGNRGGADAKDPGGRLGPYLKGGRPDLRNLKLFFSLCQPDDIILLVSDGVHDNLDPQTLGKSPDELGLLCTKWEDLPAEEANVRRQRWATDFMQKMLGQTRPEPESFTNVLVEHSLQVNQRSRKFMLDYPSRRLPSDFKEFPGKMDHTTCMAFRVGCAGNST